MRARTAPLPKIGMPSISPPSEQLERVGWAVGILSARSLSGPARTAPRTLCSNSKPDITSASGTARSCSPFDDVDVDDLRSRFEVLVSLKPARALGTKAPMSGRVPKRDPASSEARPRGCGEMVMLEQASWEPLVI